MKVLGINPAIEALRAGRVIALTVSTQRRTGLDELLRLAEAHRIRIKRAGRQELDRLARGQHHQGVVATVRPKRVATLAELAASSGPSLTVFLDGINDPHNLGAIARVAEAAGAAGLVIQARRSASVTDAAVKASAGALAHLPVASVVNLTRALKEFKAGGIWVVGLDADAEKSIFSVDLRMPVALVIGAEGHGLRRLVRDQCDWLVSLPMMGCVASLNASVATGIALFEAVRQRSQPEEPHTRQAGES